MSWGLGWKVIEVTDTAVFAINCSIQAHAPWTTLVNMISSSLMVGFFSEVSCFIMQLEL